MKISRDSITATMAKAERPSHGAERLDLPCNNNSPSDGEPGGRPSPRKSSEVSVLIDEFTTKGRKVSVATIALGRTCLTMILKLERPRARAALTYSKLRARRNSARTTWTRLTHENNNRMNNNKRKLGARTAERMIRM